MKRFCVLLMWFLIFGTHVSASQIIPVLCYHRFGPEVSDSMTLKSSVFVEQLEWLKTNGYSVIPLDTAMRYLKGQIKSIPSKSVVITVDDGHKSVYEHMAPIVKKYKIPVTLFVYPSAISNAKYAMTWDQLQELEATKWFRVESHTYWHPNFKHEKKKLTPQEYDKFVDKQLAGAKKKLEEKMGHEVKYLAWVFGIYDDELLQKASAAGYTNAFTIDRRHASAKEKPMAQPRYMVVSQHDMSAFKNMVIGAEHQSAQIATKKIGY